MPFQYLVSQLEFYLILAIAIVGTVAYIIIWYKQRPCANCARYVSGSLHEHRILLVSYEKLLHDQVVLHDYQLASLLHSLNDLEKIRAFHVTSAIVETDKLIELTYEILRINYKNLIIKNKGEIQDQTIPGIVQAILEVGIMKSYSRDDLVYQGFDRLYAMVQKKIQVSDQPRYTTQQIKEVFMDSDL